MRFYLHALLGEFEGFNTVNGIRVHAIFFKAITLLHIWYSFNTVNGIRVHAIVGRSNCSGERKIVFQYRKRYKGACNKPYCISINRFTEVSIP